MTAVGETPDLHQLESSVFPRNLQGVRPPADQDVGRRPRAALHHGTRARGCLDRIAPRSLEKPGKRNPPSFETLHDALMQKLRRVLQSVDHFGGGLIPLAA